ncbi:protein SET DOMAIN GROUP 41 isoform X7 [Brachypodium distachyon]|uniref:protein SET DOMAIN GROUP 41 isoform X7 n=1 Tax=Brachypodium distachyon TaxID=15368 RepID=UPI00052FE839|nr:protein SET DOMAIN GROUP 41 isoform X7 [Brachypodium distachyon]|eukprot:XP_024311996.1 protein SET DOMAIN GROUP 41 isoform X7 [Brachypodium distachyon]
MAMEMRAGESLDISENLTRAIAPYAMALHDEFLHSHCSSCFRDLPSQRTCVVSCMVCCSVRYCCSDCLSSDCQVHMSSGECCFFANHLEKASTSCTTEGTSDFRAALRLLYLLEMHGLVSSDSINQSSRIGGLSVSGIREVLEEGGEVSERILEGSMLMSSARKMRTQNAVVFLNGLTVEMVALWAVMINSVEVQICEGRDLGIAVYGPNFSWFNHSCFPNASYNFILAPWKEDSVSDKPPYRAVPASKGIASDAWRAWQFEDGFTHAVGKYGPRVVVRCTRPINKGDEVCIAYIDLLQTREARHSDLWSKYKFICFCKRCTASPEPYVDLILNCDFRKLNSLEDAVMSPAIENLDDILQQAISQYSLGATHHLFLSECCFMTPLSHFLLSTGQSMLDLVQCIQGGAGKNVSEAKFSFASCSVSSAQYDSIQHHQFRSTCDDFGRRMLSLSLQCWPFLAQSSLILEKIKNPIDFSWLGTTIFQSLHLSEEDSANLSYADGLPISIEEQKGCVLSLAICCINFCKYLASICYGPQHYVTIHAKDLLESINLGQ